MLKVAKLWCYWEVEPNGGGGEGRQAFEGDTGILTPPLLSLLPGSQGGESLPTHTVQSQT